MSQAKDLDHIYLEAPGLPYVPLNSPSSTVPVFVRGSNVLTTVLGDLQRRPGWATYEAANPTTFASVKRILTWNRWDGTSYLLASVVNGTTSTIYRLKVGVDANFSEIAGVANINTGVSPTEANAYDMVISNNTLYMSNGVVNWRYDGTNLYQWGISGPTVVPTTAQVSAGRNATLGGYTYVYTFGNNTTGSMSASGGSSAGTGNFTNKQIQVTGKGSADPQVTHIHIFRTTDGGSLANLFEIDQSPITNPGFVTFNVTDLTLDADLNTGSQPDLPPNGQPPIPMIGLTWFQNRIWGFNNNSVFFSAWEEAKNGIEEENFPSGADGNFYKFPSGIVALAVASTGLMIFTVNAVYLIQGDARDTFIVSRLFNRLGCRGRRCVTTMGRSVVWLDTSDTIQISDGQQVEEIGLPIRPDLVGIDHQHASLATHLDGRTHWITLLDGTAGVCRVMNLDTKLWQVPWTFGGSAIYSGEVQLGTYDLFLAASDGLIYTMTPDTFLDPGGQPYTAELVTSLFDLCGKTYSGHVGAMEYLSIERDNHALLTVEKMTDDDPNSVDSIYTDISANVKPPAQREQGDSLIEEWFFATEPRGRRISLKMTWDASNEIFRVYSLDFAYSKLT